MASLFECEIRYKIENIKKLEQRIKNLGGDLSFEYSFIDYYFSPEKNSWNLSRKNLRIRKWRYPERPTRIYFVKTEVVNRGEVKFKRALYSEGKVPLLEASLEKCRAILSDLGFEKDFEVDKTTGRFWKLEEQEFETITENIRGLGWWGELEFEGEEPEKAEKKIKRAVETLKIPKKRTTFKPISLIYSSTLDKEEE